MDGTRADGLLARVAVSAFLAMGVMVFSLSLYGIDARVEAGSGRAVQGLMRMGALALSIPVLALLGIPLADAVWRQKRWLSSESLILAGVAAAWALSLWSTLLERESVYFDTATVVLVLFTLGRWLDARARERAHDRLQVLAGERVQPATRVEGDSDHPMAAEALRVGDLVRVRPGEMLPVDGEVVEGCSFVDTASLTGEAQPRSVQVGDSVLAGTRCVDGHLIVRAFAVWGSRTCDEVAKLLAECTVQRAALVKLADRITVRFFPAVGLLAAGTALWHGLHSGPEAALWNALSVVLIACPCALGMATPLAFWVALGQAWKEGLLVRGGDVLERLARAKRVVFDKTGTLTTGTLQLAKVLPRGELAADEALRLAAALEQGSEHPIGRALLAAGRSGAGGPLPRAESFRALPGRGVEGVVSGKGLCLRRPEPGESTSALGTQSAVLLVQGERILAEFHLQARLRPETHRVLDALRRRRLDLRALTGDTRAAAQALSTELGLPVEGELLPAAKAARLAELGGGGNAGTCFVGDGLNDALVLARADVGISMRSSAGTSLESASVNLLRDDLGLVVRALDLARSAVWVARTNLAWAFLYNVAGLWLAATGTLTPVYAALAMVLSSALTLLNSSRLARGSHQEPRRTAPSVRPHAAPLEEHLAPAG
jgi:heavy metal translocating P-type ATPase